jgi:pyroglutamyl-peptidase
MNKKILVTAFEAFDKKLVNQSALVALSLHKENVEVIILPVEFSRAYETLIHQIKWNDFIAVVMLGEAKVDGILLEHIAININHARIPDNANQQPKHQAIMKDGFMTISSGLPIFKIEQVLGEKQFVFSSSYHAGTYVCNDLFYRVLSRATIPAGFIHVSDDEKWLQHNISAIQVVVDLLKVL